MINIRTQANKSAEFAPDKNNMASQILENLESGIILLDCDLTVLLINPWLTDHCDITSNTIEGENFLRVFPDMANTQLDKSIEAALRYEIKSILTHDINLNPLPIYEISDRLVRASTEKKPLKHVIKISPIKKQDGSQLCLLQISEIPKTSIRDSLLHELSLRMQDEAETLRRSSKIAENANKAKSEFLALMSHELRTPLNAIIGFGDILKTELLGPHSVSQYKEYSQHISDAGHHLLNLINDILDLSKIDAGKYSLNEENVDLPEVVRSAENLIRTQIAQNNQTLTLNYPEDLPDLIMDSRSLKQMALNLLSNAAKFTPDGGKIEVFLSQNNEKEIVFSVKDNGIGIASHEIPMIMQPFTQSESNMSRKSHGTGLGLSLVKKIVEMHGGRIDLVSQIGKGTTVTLTFPAERVIAS